VWHLGLEPLPVPALPELELPSELELPPGLGLPSELELPSGLELPSELELPEPSQGRVRVLVQQRLPELPELPELPGLPGLPGLPEHRARARRRPCRAG